MKKEAGSAPKEAAATPTFAELGLNAKIVAVLAGRGIETPTPVQAGVFAPAAEGKDVLARSRTGSGKTLAFGLPIFGRLDGSVKGAQMLVLTPTRELAAQVARELEDVAHVCRLSVADVIGGASMGRQIMALKSAQVVVATPGRLLDHIGRKTIKLDNVQAVVLDEGDEMLDMGFYDDIIEILKNLPETTQRLLFSATVPPAMKTIIGKYLRNPVLIETESPQTAHENIEHVFYKVSESKRYEALVNVLLYEPITRVLIFTRTKAESQDVAVRLATDGFSAAFINGDLSQDQRNQAMEGFRRGHPNILVATDVAARGIDVQGVSHVVHHSFPGSLETYTHRSGRTGRAGAKGTSVLFVAAHEMGKSMRVVKSANLKPVWKEVPSQDLIRKARIERLKIQLLEESKEGSSTDQLKLAQEMLELTDPARLVAALLRKTKGDTADGYAVMAPKSRNAFAEKGPSADYRDSRRSSGPGDRRDRRDERPDRRDERPMRDERPAPRADRPVSAARVRDERERGGDVPVFKKPERGDTFKPAAAKSSDTPVFKKPERGDTFKPAAKAAPAFPQTGRDERKSFDKKPAFAERGERGDRGERKDYDKKPFDKKVAGENRDSWKSFDKKPAFGEREERKSFDKKPAFGDKKAYREPGAKKPGGIEKGMEPFRIKLGRRHGVNNPGQLISLLCQKSGLKGTDFGRIDIQSNYTMFDVRTEAGARLTKKPTVEFQGESISVEAV